MTSAASTANAAVPAPGKLEFKDDYTPEEAERVIRNSKGLPVGVKPKMVWTWPKALLWAVIAIVCAIGWAILAVSRGEQIENFRIVIGRLVEVEFHAVVLFDIIDSHLDIGKVS